MKKILIALLMIALVFCACDVGDDGNSSGGNNPGGDKPSGDNPGGDKPGGNNPGGDNPDGNKPGGTNPDGNSPSDNAGMIAYSADGVTWTAVDSKLNSSISHIAYGNGTWVASTAGTTADGINLAYSSNGVTWTAATDSINSNGVNEIAWGNGKFVAVCFGGKIAYSANGINWTEVTETTFGKNGYIDSVAWGGDKFIAVGIKEGNSWKNYAYSTDGVTWSAGKGDFSSNGRISRILWANDIWVAAAGWLGIHYSTNGGDTWNSTLTDNSFLGPLFLSSGIAYFTYGNGKFVAIGTKGAIVYSSNGKDWTRGDKTFNYNSLGGGCIVWGNNKFVVAALNGQLGYSPDGITWTLGNDLFEKFPDRTTNIMYVSDMAYGDDKFVAVGMNYKWEMP